MTPTGVSTVGVGVPTLLPLLCLKCQTQLPAQPDEVAWVCPQCGQAHLLDEGQPQGLSLLEIHYTAGLPDGAVGRPFWVAQGTVALQRKSYGGGQLFSNANKQAEQFWTNPHKFFVPAFTCALEEMVSLGVGMLHQPPGLSEGGAVPFQPVTLPVEDVKSLADFIVVGIEAERSDKVKQVDFKLELQTPVLWVLA